MTYKEILDRTKLVSDLIDNRVYLVIAKKDLGDGIIEISEQREFTKEEIVKTIFQLSKIYLGSKGERTCTFHNKQQSITISADEWRGGQ